MSLYGTVSAGNDVGMKNRIINGAMVIDQRNAGGGATIDGGTTFSADRWFGEDGTDGTFSLQQTTTAPAGFKYSIKATVGTADTSLTTSQLAIVGQRIEGYNVADLDWGTANAKSITISWWTRSSATGSFGGAVWNSAGDRSYPFSYTINSADTWEYKTVTIAGDTTGTWLTTTGRGINLAFALGVGPSYSSTVNTWAAQQSLSFTGAPNLMATSGATLYITGVQLEKGSTATTFDYRPYGTEFALCQRYYQICGGDVFSAAYSSSALGMFYFNQMRIAPTATATTNPGGYTVSVSSVNNGYIYLASGAGNTSAVAGIKLSAEL